GLIAGGSLGGVLLGFLAFSDTLPDDLREYEHRTAQVATARPFREAAEETALNRLGLSGKMLSQPEKDRLQTLSNKIADLNQKALSELDAKDKEKPVDRRKLPKGTTLMLPEGKSFVVPADMTLRQVAAQQLGLADKVLPEKEQEEADK